MKNRHLLPGILLLLLLNACSRNGSPPPATPAPGSAAGEGVTWDKINAGGAAGPAAQAPGAVAAPRMVGGNAAPQILSGTFVAGSGNGESISVAVSTVDPDGDPVTVEYAWTVNGQPAGNEARLAKAIRRGDFVTVTLTPFDGKDRGRPVTLRTQVTNTPPSIAGVVDVRNDGNLYTARIQASDADGDPIRYALVSGPAGMTVEPVDGTIRWTMPPDFKGKAVFMVSARDRSGAQSTFAATIDVKENFE